MYKIQCPHLSANTSLSGNPLNNRPIQHPQPVGNDFQVQVAWKEGKYFACSLCEASSSDRKGGYNARAHIHNSIDGASASRCNRRAHNAAHLLPTKSKDSEGLSTAALSYVRHIQRDSWFFSQVA